jgi:hypothetical protein
VGVAGGVAEHKEVMGPVEALEFFFDTTTPILIDQMIQFNTLHSVK